MTAFIDALERITKYIMLAGVFIIIVFIAFPLALLLQVGEFAISLFHKDYFKRNRAIMWRFFDYITHNGDNWY